MSSADETARKSMYMALCFIVMCFSVGIALGAALAESTGFHRIDVIFGALGFFFGLAYLRLSIDRPWGT